MNFDEVNKTLGDTALGCDGDGTKLVKNFQTGKIYMVSISSNDGDVMVSELNNSPEVWEQINAAYKEAMKTEDKYYGSEAKMIDVLYSHSTRVISTSFWG